MCGLVAACQAQAVKHYLILGIILIVVGTLAYLLLCDGPSNPILPGSAWSSWMIDHGYTQLTQSHKPPNIPGDKPPVKPVAVSTASGTWIPDTIYTPADTLAVASTMIELPDGTSWIKTTIAGKAVNWHELIGYRQASDWSLIVECCVNNGDHGTDWGAGATWQPLHLWRVDIGPCVTADANPEVSMPDWYAVSVRCSYRVWRGFSLGGQVGYRIMENPGLHLGISAGIVF